MTRYSNPSNVKRHEAGHKDDVHEGIGLFFQRKKEADDNGDANW